MIIEKYYSRLTNDFHVNKKIVEECAVVPTKRLRNKIAGYMTHLMGRIQKGPVRGISFRLQEEERERKDNYVPTVSDVKTDHIEIDADTQEMLKALNFDKMPALHIAKNPTRSDNGPRRFGNRDGGNRDGGNRDRDGEKRPRANKKPLGANPEKAEKPEAVKE